MTPQLNAVALAVADLKASTEFYGRLGIEFGEPLGGHIEAELMPGFKLILDDLDTVRSYLPHWTAPTGSPRAVLAFQFDTAAEVDAKYHELTEAGHHSSHEPRDAFWGQRYATVHDPDGNGVDLYADLPTS